MNVMYEQKKNLTFIGFSTVIPYGEGFNKCPEFWEKEYSEKFLGLLNGKSPENEIEQAVLDNNIGEYAICSDGENSFEYCIVGKYNGGAVPDGMKLFTLPDGIYAVFEAIGFVPFSLQKVTKEVFSEWMPKNAKSYMKNCTFSIEHYPKGDMLSPDYSCELMVPLKK